LNLDLVTGSGSVIASIALGLGLAAAAGLRVFGPLFGAGLAAHLGYIPLHESFGWMASLPALVAFGTATALEVVAYYVPWLDHALDAVASPAAVMAGVVASASVLVDLPPAIRWGVAIIGGGGVAGLLQALTVGLRVKSSLTTGGLANPVVATSETVGAGVMITLAIAFPVIALILVAAVAIAVYRVAKRLVWRRPTR
jgi:hypothetical protein